MDLLKESVKAMMYLKSVMFMVSFKTVMFVMSMNAFDPCDVFESVITGDCDGVRDVLKGL